MPEALETLEENLKRKAQSSAGKDPPPEPSSKYRGQQHRYKIYGFIAKPVPSTNYTMLLASLPPMNEPRTPVINPKAIV